MTNTPSLYSSSVGFVPSPSPPRFCNTDSSSPDSACCYELLLHGQPDHAGQLFGCRPSPSFGVTPFNKHPYDNGTHDYATDDALNQRGVWALVHYLVNLCGIEGFLSLCNRIGRGCSLLIIGKRLRVI